MTDQVKILGMRELYEALSTKIPRSMEGKVLQKALAAATAPILRAARANATRGGEDFPNVRTGTLKRAIYSMRSKFGQTPTTEIRIVGVRKGKKAAKKGRDAWYAKLVEYGHRTASKKTGRLRKNGAASGGFAGKTEMVAPRPFMRPAWEANKDKAPALIAAKLRELLDDAIKKARF